VMVPGFFTGMIISDGCMLLRVARLQLEMLV
jgi:hypothetical protein